VKKNNRLIVCLSSFEEDRVTMMAALLVRAGFARTPGDARKIIVPSPFDVDLPGAFFVAAKTCNLRSSPATTHRLFEMALRGNFVLLGVRKIPPEMEFMCEIYTIDDFR
jgi:hypothetical protein